MTTTDNNPEPRCPATATLDDLRAIGVIETRGGDVLRHSSYPNEQMRRCLGRQEVPFWRRLLRYLRIMR